MALDALVMTGIGGLTVKVSVRVPVPPAFVAVKVMVALPVAEGVPEMSPVVVFTFNPAGRPLAPKLVGLLVAVI